jgi:predicted MPP superfamily phosphohydrolase
VSALLLGIVTIAVALILHATLIAPRRLQRTILDFPLPRLGREFDGYTLAVLADIHHWAPGTSYLRRMVRMSNDARPDLVVLLGDYGISFEHSRTLSEITYRSAFPDLTRALRELRAPDGCVAVLGNHDHYYDAPHVTEWLHSLGIPVLRNDHVALRRGDAILVIGGVGDALEDRVDASGGVGRQLPHAALVVLSHNPDGVQALDPEARIGLVLAGHTHGGQIVIPGFGALVTHSRTCRRRSASGWVPNVRVPLYVSRGIGVQVPIRFRCPPELLIVRLRVPPDQQPA